MNFKERIANHLRSSLDAGRTQAELARELGFKSGNLISMHLDPKNPISPFPLKRIPALARICDLSDQEALSLIYARANFHPTSASELDKPTLAFVLRCGVKSLLVRRASVETSHAC